MDGLHFYEEEDGSQAIHRTICHVDDVIQKLLDEIEVVKNRTKILMKKNWTVSELSQAILKISRMSSRTN